jgi:CDP-glucose 4,6-dehydratase
MFGDVYRGRRVFVTGHTGFKGSWLSAWLLRLGAEVSGYALAPPTEPNLFDGLALSKETAHKVADVRDAEVLSTAVARSRPDLVFHLAAQPIVREGYATPVATFSTNVMGTVNLLEAARRSESVAGVVVVTSDKCYRNLEDGRSFVEEDAMGGHDPYSASKGCAELVTAAYASSFFVDGTAAVASARAGNVIGGGDWAADRLVPDCVRALVAGEPVVVRNPDAVRPWQHVLEPLAGYLALGAALLSGEAVTGAWNFGPESGRDELPVRWVVERFLEEWGSGSWEAPDLGVQPHEAHLLRLDSTKARTRLLWTPLWDAREAVMRTAVWYSGYYEEPTAARKLVEDDVLAYEASAARPREEERR